MKDETAACAACETPLSGRYCHACAQDSRAKAAPLREMAAQVAISYSPVDGKMARTLAVLAVRPGRLLEAYRCGAGSLYVTPLKLFVASTALFLAVLNFSDTKLYQYSWGIEEGWQVGRALYDPESMVVSVEGTSSGASWLQPKIEPAIDPEIIAAIQAAARDGADEATRANMRFELAMIHSWVKVGDRVSAWLPNVIWVLMPLYALGLVPLFGRRRLFLEHVFFAMWAHATTFLLAMGLAAINGLGANLDAELLVLPYLAYFTVAAARYYAMSPLEALWRGMVHLTFYVFLVLFPTIIIIALTAMDWNVVADFFLASWFWA